jgi:hypothetical protein
MSGEAMTILADPQEVTTRRLRGRVRRTVTLSTKLTPQEMEFIESASKNDGRALGEWARDILLREVKGVPWEFDLTCEVVGLQLLVMNVLAPLARGEKITSEQFQIIVKSVQSAKVKAAQEMLSRRSQEKEI